MKRDAIDAVSSLMKPMKREDITDLIAFRRIKKGIKWAEVAKKVGESKEWTTAACLGQMQMTRKQAQGADPRGVRRRHHERHRLLHGHPAGAP